MWWSQRMLRMLEGSGLGREIRRGQAYAAEGRVISLAVTPGRISAAVSGTRPRPYRVLLEVKTLEEPVWSSLFEEISRRPGAQHTLASGALPGELARIIPTDPVDVAIACTCPVHDAICKHAAAVFYDFAARLVDRPRLLLIWRGCPVDEVLPGPKAPDVRSAS